ncbi:MAG: cellulase family glycosylhydrolase [bacterium]
MKFLTCVVLVFYFVQVSDELFAGAWGEKPTEGTQYQSLSFRFTENLHFTNPFDLESNQVVLVIRQPDYSSKVISFFYDGLSQEKVEQWEARFAPSQPGLHRLSIVINGKAKEQFNVQVKPHREGNDGGLKISDRLGVFEFESGKTFRGIGLNVCWAMSYEYFFKKMQASGITIARIWLCPWNLSFEWKETGLGRYNLESARRLDDIIALAERYSIYVILCMDYHGIAPKGMGYFKENRWLASPYNRMNGGPCANEADLFTDPEAKEYYKKKYKYIVSRYGASAHLAAWEFFNEADLMAGQSIPINRWHIEMAEYVKSIDVHKRLVSSSSTRKYIEKLVDAFKSPATDFVMFHEYNTLNMAPYVIDLHEAATEYYQKPVILGEFGIEFRGGDRTFKADSQHIGLHNGIWAGWFSETPVVPMSWWWDNYIDAHNLWHEYAALTRFAQSMEFEGKHLAFKTLDPGYLIAKPKEQAACMVRCIYFSDHAALWLKHLDYQWSLVSEGIQPAKLGSFTQVVPHLVPGQYTVRWYDPQAGQFSEKLDAAEVKQDGVLSLTIPVLTTDLACLLIRKQ